VLPPSPVSTQAIRNYLQALYPAEATGYRTLLRFEPTPTVEWFAASDLEGFANRAAELAPHTSLYHSMGILQHPLPGSQRGTVQDVIAIPSLWADVDYLDAVHKKTNLPATPQAALELLAEFPLPPSLILDTGHGFHAHWILAELWTFDTDDERSEAQDLLDRFQHTLIAKARAHGWDMDNTSDLARVLRVGGSLNWKDPQHVRPVEVIFHDPARRYSPSDFEPYLLDLQAERPTRTVVLEPLNLDDQELLRRTLWRTKWRRLYEDGYLGDYGGDWNRADLALCDAFIKAGASQEQAERLWRSSALWRPKGDEVHRGDGATYAEMTTEKALQQLVPQVVDPSAPEVEPTSDTVILSRPQYERYQRLERDHHELQQTYQTLVDYVEKYGGPYATLMVAARRCASVESRHLDADGYVYVSNVGMAIDDFGIPKEDEKQVRQVSKKLGDHLLRHGVEPGVFKAAEPETEMVKKVDANGEIRWEPLTRRKLALNVPIYGEGERPGFRDFLTYMVRDYHPGEKRGGKREPRVDVCPEHPDAPLKHRTSCTVCDRTIGPVHISDPPPRVPKFADTDDASDEASETPTRAPILVYPNLRTRDREATEAISPRDLRGTMATQICGHDPDLEAPIRRAREEQERSECPPDPLIAEVLKLWPGSYLVDEPRDNGANATEAPRVEDLPRNEWVERAVTIVQHSCVFGQMELPVVRFKVGDVRPWSQYDRSVTVTFEEPQKPRQRKRIINSMTMASDERYLTIEAAGEVLYDSRAEVPLDSVKWEANAARLAEQRASWSTIGGGAPCSE
jgi:hypothetical protein